MTPDLLLWATIPNANATAGVQAGAVRGAAPGGVRGEDGAGARHLHHQLPPPLGNLRWPRGLRRLLEVSRWQGKQVGHWSGNLEASTDYGWGNWKCKEIIPIVLKSLQAWMRNFTQACFFNLYGETIKICSLWGEEQYTNCLITITLLPCSIGTVICEQFWINV